MVLVKSRVKQCLLADKGPAPHAGHSWGRGKSPHVTMTARKPSPQCEYVRLVGGQNSWEVLRISARLPYYRLLTKRVSGGEKDTWSVSPLRSNTALRRLFRSTATQQRERAKMPPHPPRSSYLHMQVVYTHTLLNILAKIATKNA